jgi:hypothetical protein
MASSELVHLHGGLTVSLSAWRLLLQLEDLNFTIRLLGDSLQVSPVGRITPALAAAIRAHRHELIALVHYEPPLPAWSKDNAEEGSAGPAPSVRRVGPRFGAC